MENAFTSNPSAPIRVFVAEDSPEIRERLIQLICENGNVSVVGEAATTNAAIEGILALLPDVVTLDIQLLDGSGLHVIREVHKQSPDMPFVVLTNSPDPFYRRAFAKEGAHRFLDKNKDFNRVEEEIIAACATRRERPIRPASNY
jgi:DNA-binding NarL/FixJ family response regulator